MTYIIGHKKPDTDSVISAICYANLKNTIDKGFIPAITDDVNPETKFILKKFNIEKPILLKNVKTSVSDCMDTDFETLNDYDSVKQAGDIIKNSNITAIAVCDNKKYKGLITINTLSKLFLEQLSIEKSAEKLSLEIISENLNGEIIASNSSHVFGDVFIGAMSRTNMDKFVKSGDIVIVGNRKEVIMNLIEKKVSLIIITGGVEPDKHIVSYAKDYGVAMIKTSYDTFKTARLINLSSPVSSKMEKPLPILQDMHLTDVYDEILQSSHRLPVVNSENELVGMISRKNLKNKGKKVILVDHTEKNQAAEGINEAEIIEIIDHHNLGDIVTSNPIYIRHEPVGCTATIIKKLYKENDVQISKKIASLLISAIISDTLYLRSSTATKEDEKAIIELNEIACINLDAFAKEIFEAKSEIRSVSEIIGNDKKEYTINDRKISISQIETMNPKEVMKFKSEIIEEMKKDRLYASFLMITDIFNRESRVITVGDSKVIKKIGGELVTLVGVMSRKKDFVPKIYNLI